MKKQFILFISILVLSLQVKSQERPILEKMGLYQHLGKETQKRIPGSILVELDNIGHLPHIESFELFINPFLEFLKD